MLSANKKKIIQELSGWLSHPGEMGVKPKKILYKRAYTANFIGIGKETIHLLNYEMPDGTKGRGFVNPITWSFMGEGINAISDENLVIAYCGWAWVFTGVNQGRIQRQFEPSEEKALFKRVLKKEGFTEIIFGDSYKILDSELYEFNAQVEGKGVSGAGNLEEFITLEEDTPQYQLPPVYFLLGKMMI